MKEVINNSLSKIHESEILRSLRLKEENISYLVPIDKRTLALRRILKK